MATPARRLSNPPLPASFPAIQVVQATARPNATVNDLTALCQNDVGFAARMLAYVNHTGFGQNRRVGSVQHAVALLGIRGTRNVAVGMCVVEMTPPGEPGDALLSVCLRRAVIARMLAEKLERSNTDDYFTVGLLLEVGLLVKVRNDLEQAATLARAPAETRLTLERAAGQEDHAKLGARLARSWQLGEELANAVYHHHDRLPLDSPLGSAAWLSERMAAVFESVNATRSRVLAIEAGALVQMPAATIDAILQSVPDAVSEAARQFGHKLPPQVSLDTLLRDADQALGELTRNYSEVVLKLETLLQEKEQLSNALKEADEKLSSLALTDGVSGLPNQRAFREALLRDLARADRSETPVAVLALDIDHFAELTEQQGQSAADVVLSAIAEILLRCIRTSDVAARIGGERFALLLPNTNIQGAYVVAERVRAQLSAWTFMGARGQFTITVSIGVAVTAGPECRGREDALFAAAESGLEMAEQAGHNRVMVGSL
jgi:two-component system, cell cycle response regulator